MVTRTLSLTALSAVLLAACSGSDTPDLGMTQMDAGTGGTDMGMTMPDMGMVQTDTGVQGPCNPVDGTGCMDSAKFCLFRTGGAQAGSTVCADPQGMIGHEAACSEALQNCAEGFACVDLGAGALCHQVCAQASGAACQTLQGNSPSYVCSGINGAGTEYGVCVGAGTMCDPSQGAAACGMNETCVFANNSLNCAPSGATAIGGDCSMEGCMPGGLCLSVDMGPICYEACDTNIGMCSNMNDICQGLIDGNMNPLPFGVCLANTAVACDPLMPTACMNGDVCSLVGANTECVPAGPTTLGQTCDNGANNCAVDQGLCIDLGMGAACREVCDPNGAAMCTMGACNGLMDPDGNQLPWGVCL